MAEATKELTIAALLEGAKASPGDKEGNVIVQRADAVEAVGAESEFLNGSADTARYVAVDRLKWIEALEKTTETKPARKPATAKE